MLSKNQHQKRPWVLSGDESNRVICATRLSENSGQILSLEESFLVNRFIKRCYCSTLLFISIGPVFASGWAVFLIWRFQVMYNKVSFFLVAVMFLPSLVSAFEIEATDDLDSGLLSKAVVVFKPECVASAQDLENEQSNQAQYTVTYTPEKGDLAREVGSDFWEKLIAQQSRFSVFSNKDLDNEERFNTDLEIDGNVGHNYYGRAYLDTPTLYRTTFFDHSLWTDLEVHGFEIDGQRVFVRRLDKVRFEKGNQNDNMDLEFEIEFQTYHVDGEIRTRTFVKDLHMAFFPWFVTTDFVDACVDLSATNEENSRIFAGLQNLKNIGNFIQGRASQDHATFTRRNPNKKSKHAKGRVSIELGDELANYQKMMFAIGSKKAKKFKNSFSQLNLGRIHITLFDSCRHTEKIKSYQELNANKKQYQNLLGDLYQIVNSNIEMGFHNPCIAILPTLHVLMAANTKKDRNVIRQSFSIAMQENGIENLDMIVKDRGGREELVEKAKTNLVRSILFRLYKKPSQFSGNFHFVTKEY